MGAACTKENSVEEPRLNSVAPESAPHHDKTSTAKPTPHSEPHNAATLPHEKEHAVSHMIVCYICGQKYSHASLPIHQQQCPAKREANLKDIPKSLRPPMPTKPTLSLPTEKSSLKELTLYNEAAEKSFYECQCSCPNCARKFEPDRLMVHLKSCKDKHGEVWHEQEKKHKSGGQKMIMCYMCGQKYSSASLPIHQKQCPTKREANLRTIPVELRPAEPVVPELPTPGDNCTVEEVETYNEQAYESFRSIMCKCPHKNCGRRFEPDRLMVHLRSCRDEDGELWSEEKHPTYKANKSVPKAVHGDHMVVCYCCGKKYSTASLPIHQKQCPAKRKANFKDVPKEIRPPIPDPPSLSMPDARSSVEEIAAYNEEAEKINYEAMCKCPHPKCGRRFEPDRLLVHLRSCKDEKGELWSADVHAPKPSRRRMVVCYSCGLEYSTASLPIHLKDCPEKRAREYATVPEQCQGEEPTAPEEPMPNEKASLDEIESYNEEARHNYVASMAHCAGCKRKFEPGPLQVHLRSCKK